MHRTSECRPTGLRLVVLVLLVGVAGEVAAADTEAKHYFRFSGTPGSIVCTPTSNTIHPGLKASWSVPADTPVHAVVKVNNTVVVDEAQFPPSLKGTVNMEADTTSWATETPFPYTVVHTMTPLVSDAESSSISYDCVKGKGINFKISNAPAK